MIAASPSSMDTDEEDAVWDSNPDADHAVWWMVMDVCPRDLERAIKTGKVAFLAKFLELPPRVLVKRMRAFKKEMVEEGRQVEDWCSD